LEGWRGYWDLSTSGNCCSTSYFFETRWLNRTLEIGWTWLSPAYWRTAVNTAAKYLLLRHAFEALGAYRVELMTDVRNLRSQRAIERLGASREGLARSHMICPDGFRRDSVLYSLLDHAWPTVKARLEAMLAHSE
jgi:N-acetyltransferase